MKNHCKLYLFIAVVFLITLTSFKADPTANHKSIENKLTTKKWYLDSAVADGKTKFAGTWERFIIFNSDNTYKAYKSESRIESFGTWKILDNNTQIEFNDDYSGKVLATILVLDDNIFNTATHKMKYQEYTTIPQKNKPTVWSVCNTVGLGEVFLRIPVEKPHIRHMKF